MEAGSFVGVVVAAAAGVALACTLPDYEDRIVVQGELVEKDS